MAQRLVHIVDEVPGLDDGDHASLTLVLVLDGFLDAGNAAARAARHLVDLQGGQGGPVVATFDVDELHDYRARRPAMSFVRDHYESYDAPRLVVRLLAGLRRDAVPAAPRPRARHPLGGLLRGGPRGRRALRRDPRRRHGCGADGGAAHPADRDHRARQQHRAASRATAGGAASCASRRARRLSSRCGWGSGVTTPWASSRTSRTTSPSSSTRAASAALLEHVERAGRLTIDLSALRAEAEEREAEITRYLAANEEVDEVVTALEQQYDAFTRAEESGSNLLAGDQPLPTGEEIGQQFEQFLAGLDRPDNPNDN